MHKRPLMYMLRNQKSRW